MFSRREIVKIMLKISNSPQEIDIILERYANCKTYPEKIAYMQGMFDCDEIDCDDSLDDKSLFELLSVSISSPIREETEVVDNTGKYVDKKEVLKYIERVKNCGLGKAKSLDFISKYIKSMNSYDSIE